MIWLGGKTDRAPGAEVVILINVCTARSFQESRDYLESAIWPGAYCLGLHSVIKEDWCFLSPNIAWPTNAFLIAQI